MPAAYRCSTRAKGDLATTPVKRNQSSDKENEEEYVTPKRGRGAAQKDAETPTTMVTRSMQQLSCKDERKSKRRIFTKAEGLKANNQQLASPEKRGKQVKKSALTGSPPKKQKVDDNIDDEEDSEGSVEEEFSLAKVRRLLHTSEIPEKLPCREEEYEKVSSFIKDTVKEKGRSQVLYICGIPGTGKTATVVQVVQNLKKSHKFKSALVNAMELTDPKRIFVNIYTQLCEQKKKIAASEARRKMNHLLDLATFGARPDPIIVVIDELDSLCKNRQEMVYDIFNWTEKPNCRVGVIAIANTFDLHEQFLARRIVSRMGTNRIQFQPYGRDELEEIIRFRLRNSDAMDKEVVEFASRTVGAHSGDLRKALDMIRRAAQIAIDKNEKRISMTSVVQARSEAISDVQVDYISALSTHSKLILHAALSLQTDEKEKDQSGFLFCDLYEVYYQLCPSYEMTALSSSSVYRNAMEMCSSHILFAAPGVNTWTRRFQLGMTMHQARVALNKAEGYKR